jgi:hypothetical protein
VAHTCDPSYSGVRDQEDHRSMPAWANQIVLENLSWKHPSQKKADEVAQGVGPEFKPQYHTHTIEETSITNKLLHGWKRDDLWAGHGGLHL